MPKLNFTDIFSSKIVIYIFVFFRPDDGLKYWWQWTLCAVRQRRK